MTLDPTELWARWVLAGATAAFLAAALWGMWQTFSRPAGLTMGLPPRRLLRPGYLVFGLAYLGLLIVLWRPLPLWLSPAARASTLALGVLLYFSGLGLWVWGRVTLGRMFGVSSSLGAQLYSDHQLITHGPFAFVRHPMYLGLIVAALGALLVYRTWGAAVLFANFLALSLRARREEEALAAQFGEAWRAYRRRVPGWVPRIRPGRGAK